MSRPATIPELRDRLNEVRELRGTTQGYPPRVEYCLFCDEEALVVRNDDGEYNHLDCSHREFRISDGPEHGGISAWIHCIEYITENDIETP